MGFIDAKEYGSILNVDVTLEDLNALDKRLDDVDVRLRKSFRCDVCQHLM